jgi:hypothetical protein
LVKVGSYGRYGVSGFWFHSTAFEALHPLAATTNSGVVTKAIDVEGCETNYYEIINKILEFSFTVNKELKVVFFDCDWFDSNNSIRQNEFGMVEVKHNEWLWGYDMFILAHQVEQVYYLSYPCQKLNALWVVYKVNPCERLHTSGDAGYHDTLELDDNVDEVYQEEELPPSFAIDPGAGLDDIVGDADDIEMPAVVKRKQKPTKKKVWLPKLRTRLPDCDADEFWNYLHVLLFIHNFFHFVYFLLIFVLTTYSLKQDVKTPG